MNSLITLAPHVSVPPGALRFSFSRSPGPGGQNVNKRSTKAELRVALADLPISPAAVRRVARLAGTVGGRVVAADADAGRDDSGELLITADENRSQRRNRDACIDRLRELLTAAVPEPKPRRPTRPTKSSKARRLQAKSRRSAAKQARRRPADD
jgi:ribosome-associated protein